MAKVVINGSTGTVISEDFGPASVARQARYDVILTERALRLAAISEDMQELEDDRALGVDLDDTKLDALRQSRRDVRERAKDIKVDVDALGTDAQAILNFDVIAAYNA